MSKKKKSGHKDKTLEIIVFVTAILNLIEALMNIIKKLIE